MGKMWDKNKIKIANVGGGGHLNRLASRLGFMSRQSKSGILKSDKKIKAYGYGVSVFVVTFLVTMLAASVFNAPGETSAESGDNTSSASASGYNLSVSATSNVNLNLSVSDSDTMTISEGYVSVITNSPGYRLYISMTGDNTSLTGVKDGLSSTIAATSGTIAAPTSLTRGTWGYAIPSGTAHLVSNNFSSSYSTTTSTTPDSSKLFAVPPVASSNPALLASSTSATSGDTYPVYYAVQANSDTTPGNYTNNIAFTAVADAGSVDKVTLTPSSIESNTATTVTVATTMYSTADYLEAAITLGSGTILSCARTSSAPLTYSCTIPATAAGTYTITLTNSKYAKTYTASLEVVNPVSYMQDTANIAACKVAATGTTFTLTDSRDNEEYTVRKLADGNCWMTQNLRLQNKTISNADSNLPSSKTVTIPASSTSLWCTTISAACDDQLMTLDATDTSISGQSSAQADYGVYYNWYTATATYGTYPMSSGSVSYDICPKGWRLPTGGSSGEFQTLYGYYGSSADMRSTTGPAFVLSGYRRGGSTDYQGGYGAYWSSTALNSSNAYDLYLNSSSVGPALRNLKYYGFSVRCVAK
ncbi:fibrobacter succinogenes major paralogous domain-containing protein [Candidatus Saccharibacteria bacterium]|nr:fibrobacter succinogenes major paralogous domain-containing protein [Candidatus Saccharibacteria bacterium]